MTFIFDLDELRREAMAKPVEQRTPYLEYALALGVRIIREREAYRQVALSLSYNSKAAGGSSGYAEEVDNRAREILTREAKKV